MRKVLLSLIVLVVMAGFSPLQVRAEESDYSIIEMFRPGLSVDTDVFAQYGSFKATGYPWNSSEYTIEKSYFAFALTDSEGKVKELISDIHSMSNMEYGDYMPVNNADCIIRVEIEIGDWVCMVYQNNHTDDDGWKVIEPYAEDIPWRIIITEDNLGEPLEHVFTLYQYSKGLTVSTNLFYTGVEFTANSDPFNLSGEAVETYIRYALTDSDGEVKEWISDLMSLSLEKDYHMPYSNTPCAITGSITVGDRIRLLYQGNPDKEDSWMVMGPYKSDVPWEVEITEDMIIDYENDTTGISSLGANNGEGDGNIYTIQGIRVNDMNRPGIYIVNGKKILVK